MIRDSDYYIGDIITSRGIKARYEATLEQLARERCGAAYAWTRLHWWQWHKRKRLWRALYSGGGWLVPGVSGVPERVTRCGCFKRYHEGGC